MSERFTLTRFNVCVKSISSSRQDDEHLQISTFKCSWCVLSQVILLNSNSIFIEEAAHKDNH